MDTVDWIKNLAIAQDTRIGDFIVDRFVGQGGTAAVYKGRHATRDDWRPVAIKILNPTMLNLEVERHRLDRQLRLRDHPCPYLIQPILWFPASIKYLDGTEFSTLIDISEYVDGHPLIPTRLPNDRVRPILSMISQAARYLEQCNFCHRDIKPDNIIVTPDMKRAVLLDLGVLHAYQQSGGEPSLTGVQTNHELVTRRYSSPEILSGELGPNSPPAEWLAHTLYQIGAIMFEAITERTIFDGKTGDALVSAIVRSDPFDERPVTRCHDLEVAARTCLSKRPRERLAITWEELECKRQARTPIIVLLYCGGTIGASTDPRGKALQPRKLNERSPLPKKVTERLKRDYEELAPDSPLPEIEWRFVAEHLQIFSENANAVIWNGIADAVSRIFAEDWSGKYLSGLILLHGTDTLAYTAAALQLAFPRTPCPIVVTGSNQPPSDEDDVELSWHTSQSDAWANLLRSVLFIVDGGHRVPMVYVAFANTICHAVNVQKTPLNRLPIRFAAAFRFLAEAFGYRNVELGRRFAYKYVEGVLLNNFLPVFEQTAVEGAPPGGHAPWERSSLDIERVRPIAQFSSAVDAVTLIPCNVRGFSIESDLQLVIAYPSGTVSDAVRKNFSGQHTIVTQWGLSPHQAEYAAAAGLPEVDSKLYRLIPESALPLLSLALAHQDLVDVETGIASIVARNPIVGALIGNPLHRENQRSRAEYIHNRATKLHERTIDSTLFPSEHYDSPAVIAPDVGSFQAGQRLVVFRRRHWDALIYGLIAPHAHSGCIAEQFAALCDIGFDTGVSIAVEWDFRRSPTDGLEARDDLMKAVGVAIIASGLGRIKTNFCVEKSIARLRLTSKLEACQQMIYAEAWAFDSTSDHRFLTQIESGMPLDIPDQSGDYFVEELDRLHATNKVIRTTPVYWYILGIVKGALCWFLSDRGTEPLRSAGAVRPTVMLRLLPRKKGIVNDEAQFVFAKRLIDRAADRDTLPLPE